MKKITILVVDDNNEIREYFISILNHEADIEIIGSASSGMEAVKIAEQLHPDIILMDIQMETRTAGIDAARQIIKEHVNTKVIILTILEDDDLLFQAYCAGVMDYIIKTDSISQILDSIRRVYSNELILRPLYAEKIIDELNRVKAQQKSLMFSLNILSKLSNSEFEILKYIYQGMSYKQISEARYVSSVTVKSQIHSILKKFGMRSMKEVNKKLDEVRFDQIIEQL